MNRIRVIPVLLLKNGGLYKTVRFSEPKYVGDPINAVRIFNEKEVDELVLLDIWASRSIRNPDYKHIIEITSEAFMPVAYGGGIKTLDQAKELLYNGVEKVVINSSAVQKPSLITEIATRFGSQCVVVSVDVKKNFWGNYNVFWGNGKTNTGKNPKEYAKEFENLGAGEILLNSIDRDGTYAGYDIELVKSVTSLLNIPVIVCGGAGSIHDFSKVVKEGGASAVAAGSMFVFQRPHRAVLISYPTQSELKSIIK